jgi:hypothetical protein
MMKQTWERGPPLAPADIDLVEAKPNKVNGVNAVSKRKVALKAEIMIKIKELQERLYSLPKKTKKILNL